MLLKDRSITLLQQKRLQKQQEFLGSFFIIIFSSKEDAFKELIKIFLTIL